MKNLLTSLDGKALTPLQALLLEQQRRNRVAACEHDFEQFCYTYFPQYFYAEPSAMHSDFFAQIDEVLDNGIPDKVADAAPRGNAKSTIKSMALPIYAAVYKKKHYILIVSDTAGQANDFLAAIRSEFEDNERLRNDFGDLTGSVWTNSDIILDGDEVRIQALGAGKKIRGRRFHQWRPDLIICDDLENDENVESPDQRKKMKSWHSKALSKAGDERTDIFIIGTIIHYDSLLAGILKNPMYKSKKYQAVIKWSDSNLWDEWERIITNLTNPNRFVEAEDYFNQNKDVMLNGTQVLWPDKESYYELMIQRLADGPAAFSSEKQNEPLSDEDRRFHPDWIQYYDDAEIVGKDLYIVASVDPSMGKAGGDYSGIVTLGMDTNSQIYVLEADIEKRHPDVIIDDVLNKQTKYAYEKVGVEDNQFQEFFKDSMNKRAAELAIQINIVGVRAVSDKILRIESLQPDIKNGRIKFRRDQQRLIEQLVNFPSADHDDGPDALEIGVKLLGKRSAFADYYKDKADEQNKKSTPTFFQNSSIQNFVRQ
jgi:predicted phage terminase large subunit-like protein